MQKEQTVVVIAGTTESRTVIEHLLKEEQPKRIVATTATSLGSEMLKEYPITIREGKLTKEGFRKLFDDIKPDKVIDASHPFAVLVTQTVQTVCKERGVCYERVERKSIDYDYEKVIHVANIEEAISYLNEKFSEDFIFLTTGSNTLKQYVEQVKNGRERIYARVIDCEYSKNICKTIPLEDGHIFYKKPPFLDEDTKKVLQEKRCKVLVTKDSGKEGGVDRKIEVAKQLDCFVLLIDRPKTESKEERKKQNREKQEKVRGIMIAGTGSGCGKTTITCAIMKALVNRNIKVAPFKCGPDYIDPMFQRYITGYPSYNLDSYFMEQQALKEVFASHQKKREFAVVEGVMGFYDGMGLSHTASSYEISEQLELPVVLVLSVKGMSATIAALLHGMITYRRNRIRGIILNQCSKVLYERLKVFLEDQFHIPVLGYLLVDQGIKMKERHLGLMTAMEMKNLDEIIERLGELAEQCLDLDEILKIGNYEPISEHVIEPKKECIQREEISIAVASDEAFCFCYEDNIEYLREQGVRIQQFSPLWDTKLPEGIHGIYLPGGYPELYAEVLEQNHSMKASIKKAIQMRMPVIAECGGYIYLCDELLVQEEAGKEQKAYSMVGVIPQTIEMTGKLNRHFGYVKITTKKEGLFGEEGVCMKGHEFHYSKEQMELDGCLVEKADKSRFWEGVYYTETMYAGYPHVPFRSNERAIRSYLEKAREMKG